MSDLCQTVRGYRPSRQSIEGPNAAGREAVRLANLERYVLRAQAGLPIFDDADEPAAPKRMNRAKAMADTVSA